MNVRSNLVMLVVSLGLCACGATNREAKEPEADPWADYKGTYATTAAAGTSGKNAPKTEAAHSDVPVIAPVVAGAAPAAEAAPVSASGKKGKTSGKAAKKKKPVSSK